VESARTFPKTEADHAASELILNEGLEIHEVDLFCRQLIPTKQELDAVRLSLRRGNPSEDEGLVDLTGIRFNQESIPEATQEYNFRRQKKSKRPDPNGTVEL
jgi:hypothetical protein